MQAMDASTAPDPYGHDLQLIVIVGSTHAGLEADGLKM